MVDFFKTDDGYEARPVRYVFVARDPVTHGVYVYGTAWDLCQVMRIAEHLEADNETAYFFDLEESGITLKQVHIFCKAYNRHLTFGGAI